MLRQPVVHRTGSSYGFRPGRDSLQLLASLEAEMVSRGHYVLAHDDVQTAFDSVRVADVVDAHRRRLGADADDLVNFIETIIRGHAGQRRTQGIDQGSPYSPLALNLVLDEALDTPLALAHYPWRQHRYADDLVCLAASMSEGREALEVTASLLDRIHLRLKGESGGPVDLREGSVDVLGFRVTCRDDRLVLALDDRAWRRLDEHLPEAHLAANPPEAARAAIRGWITAYGPTFESMHSDDLHRLHVVVNRNGFHGAVPPRRTLRENWRLACVRWETLRRSAQRSYGGTHEPHHSHR